MVDSVLWSPLSGCRGDRRLFFMDIMSSAQDDAKCHQFADYMLENYVSSDARYPLSFGQIFHEKEVNGPEAFHSHFNGQFYSTHPSIFIFIGVITKIQTSQLTLKWDAWMSMLHCENQTKRELVFSFDSLKCIQLVNSTGISTSNPLDSNLLLAPTCKYF